MELLESKVLDLQAWHQANTDKIRELKDIIAPLERKNLDLTNEINQINNEIARLSGDLDDYTKELLFEDLNKIDKLCSATRYSEDSFCIELKYVELTEPIYTINIGGDIKNMRVTILTGSKQGMNIIRQCFTDTYHYEPNIVQKMNAISWYKGPQSCSSDSYKYNKDIAESILCPAAYAARLAAAAAAAEEAEADTTDAATNTDV
jgi:hypothetical protein